MKWIRNVHKDEVDLYMRDFRAGNPDRNIITLKPKATATQTEDELIEAGIVGLWEIDGDNAAKKKKQAREKAREKATENVNFRVSPGDKQLMQEAADLDDRALGPWVKIVALKAAKEALKQGEG